MRFMAVVLIGVGVALSPLTGTIERVGGAAAQSTVGVDGRTLAVQSGLDLFIEDIAPNVVAGFDQAGLPEDVAEAAFRAAEAAFDPVPMIDAISAALDANLTAEQMDTVSAFYQSPLGGRILAMEKAAIGADRQDDYASALAEVAAALEADPARAQAIDDINAAIYAAEFGTYFARTVLRAMLTGLISAQNDSPTVDSEVLDVLVDEQMAAVAGSMEELTTMTAAHAYRDAEQADLEAYLVFLKNDAAQAFYAATYAALAASLDSASFDFGQRMAEALSAKGI